QRPLQEIRVWPLRAGSRPYYFCLQTLRVFAAALARYRGVRRGSTLKNIDEAFWEKFQAIWNEMAVKDCYQEMKGRRPCLLTIVRSIKSTPVSGSQNCQRISGGKRRSMTCPMPSWTGSQKWVLTGSGF